MDVLEEKERVGQTRGFKPSFLYTFRKDPRPLRAKLKQREWQKRTG